jgi:WD40 repeat protein
MKFLKLFFSLILLFALNSNINARTGSSFGGRAFRSRSYSYRSYTPSRSYSSSSLRYSMRSYGGSSFRSRRSYSSSTSPYRYRPYVWRSSSSSYINRYRNSASNNYRNYPGASSRDEHHYITLKYESAPLARSKRGYMKMITLVIALITCALVLFVVVKRSVSKRKLIAALILFVDLAMISYLILHYIYKNDATAEFKNAHKSSIQCLAFSNDDKLIFSSCSDGKIKLWRFPSFKFAKTITEEPFVINHFAISNDKKHLAITSGNIKLIDIKGCKVIKEFNVDKEHRKSIQTALEKNANKPKTKIKIVRLKYNFRSVAISSDNKLIAGTTDFGIYLWNIKTGKLIKKIKRRIPKGLYLAFSYDNKRLLLMLRLKPFHTYSINTGKLIAPDRRDFYINSEKKYFALKNRNIGIQCDYYSGLAVFNLKTYNILKTYEGIDEFINSVAVSKNGRYILTGGSKNSITIWEYNF